MKKDTGWKSYLRDNSRYADIINGIGCAGKQLVKASDLAEADTEEKGKARDNLRKVAFGVNFAIIGIESQEEVDYKIHIVDIRRLENTDLFQTDVKHVFDMIRYSENKQALLELVTKNEYYKRMDEDALELVTLYTNSKELIELQEVDCRKNRAFFGKGEEIIYNGIETIAI